MNRNLLVLIGFDQESDRNFKKIGGFLGWLILGGLVGSDSAVASRH